MSTSEMLYPPLEQAPKPFSFGRRAVAGLALAATTLLGVGCDTAPQEQPGPVAPAVSELSPTAELAEATVQLRFTHPDPNLKGGDPSALTPEEIEYLDYHNSEPGCSAAYIGDGWFATASHCFDSALHIGGGYYDQTYDSVSDMNGTYDVWAGPNTHQMKHIGEVDSVIVNGNTGIKDMAMVHVDEAQIPDDLPALEVTTDTVMDAYSYDETYYIAGYPQSNEFSKIGLPLEYVGLTSGQAFNDAYGLGQNLSPLPIFGVRKGSTATPADNCRPGMSGSVVINSSGEALGVLSRYSPGGDTLWSYAESSLEPEAMSEYETFCLLQPFDELTVEYYQTHKGIKPSSQRLVGK